MFNKILRVIKKYDTILFILGLVVTAILLLGVAKVYAGVETIKDDNDGNKGYILINTGTQQGNNDVGHWTDIKDVPELKGDKGDKGDTGATGQQGIPGEAGQDGQNGLDGLNGEKGDKGDLGAKGDNGQDGLNGAKGDVGDKGDTGKEGYTPIKNTDYFDGINGKNGKDFDPKEVNRLDNRVNDVENRVSKLEKTQYVAEAEFRVYDSKHLTISPFLRQNFTRNKLDTVGVRFTIKLGSSYEEREIEKTNARLDRTEARLTKVEEKLVQPAYIEKTTTKNFWGKTTKTSWHITAQPTGIAVGGKF
jgi:hypothetical protein